ncbi:MAG: hypothetical protein ACR2RL_21100 [Gammaproteobacteria bacterium]
MCKYDSRAVRRNWPAAVLVCASLALLTGCGDAPVDDGANRSEAKSEALRERLSTTQVDR